MKSANFRRQSSRRSQGALRIIAGKWRSRTLPVVAMHGLRPTSDRMRETLFNWLAPYTSDATVLDCFAGTGALSLEAVSRGAASALLLESSKEAVSVLKDNLARLDTDQVQVIQTDTLRWLAQSAKSPVDLVFLDPPFRTGLLEESCLLLEQNGHLHSETLVYIEAEREMAQLPVPAHWTTFREKTAGQVCCRLMRITS